MQKTKSNALWNELSDEQRNTLDQWLFEENLSYDAILPKAHSELGFTGSMGSLRRYYARRKQEKLATDFTETVTDAVEIEKLGVAPDAARKAGIMVMGAHLFRMLREAPEKVKEWGPVASLLLQNNHNEAWREIKGEEQKIRREALDFAKGKFQMDMVEQALMALPDLIELEQARRAVEPNAYVENAHLNRIRRKMFGVVWEVRPESPEEEAAMVERKAKGSREADEVGEAEGKERRITGPEVPVPGSAHYEEYLEWKKKCGTRNAECGINDQGQMAKDKEIPREE